MTGTMSLMSFQFHVIPVIFLCHTWAATNHLHYRLPMESQRMVKNVDFLKPKVPFSIALFVRPTVQNQQRVSLPSHLLKKTRKSSQPFGSFCFKGTFFYLWIILVCWLVGL